MIQGGDPTGTGSGGPGYSTATSRRANAKYTPGVVAMAKAGNEPAGTAGSQFFVVTGAGRRPARPTTRVLGKVTKGMDVVAGDRRSSATRPVAARARLYSRW